VIEFCIKLSILIIAITDLRKIRQTSEKQDEIEHTAIAVDINVLVSNVVSSLHN